MPWLFSAEPSDGRKTFTFSAAFYPFSYFLGFSCRLGRLTVDIRMLVAAYSEGIIGLVEDIYPWPSVKRGRMTDSRDASR